MPSDNIPHAQFVQVDLTKLTPEQKKVLDELLAAANKKPLTPTEILENRIKNLEDQIAKLSNRVYALEISTNYTTTKYKDSGPNGPIIWPQIEPFPPFLSSPTIPNTPFISTTGGHDPIDGAIGTAQGSIYDPTTKRPINPNDDR